MRLITVEYLVLWRVLKHAAKPTIVGGLDVNRVNVWV